MERHVIFYASGSKGQDVRADGNGGHLPRGHYFVDRRGVTRGPFKSVRIAAGARDADLTYPSTSLGSYREQMIDAGRGHLLRGTD